MRKRLLAFGAAVCLTLSGCAPGGGDPAPSPTPSQAVQTAQPVQARRFCLPLDPAGDWDPYGGGRSSNLSLLPLICESLFTLDSAFACHPLLAQSAQASQDGLTWTVTLREGVRFSDGEVLTAKVAAEAVNAARAAKSVYAARLAGVRRVTWDQGQTLTFTLSAPNARFPALLDFPIARTGQGTVVGTGPYILEEDGLVAHTGWWQGHSLPLGEIPFLEIPDAGALVASFNTGELSLAAADPTGADAMGYSGGGQVWEYPTSSLLYLGFQCGRGPCGNAAFRRALSRALDRSTLVRQALEGHAQGSALPLPPGAPGYDAQAAKALEFDAAGAEEELDKLYPRGEDGMRRNGRWALTLELLVNADNPFKEKLAHALAGELETAGIGVEVQALAWEEYKKALEGGKFDLYLGECRLTGDLDPTPLITAGSGLCYGGFRSRELTAALAQARQTGEWAAFYDQWAQDVPVAALGFKNGELLTQWGQVTGAAPTQGNLFYGLENWRIS